jgi:steroid delta-isomerase-like uncharacterized protein
MKAWQHMRGRWAAVGGALLVSAAVAACATGTPGTPSNDSAAANAQVVATGVRAWNSHDAAAVAGNFLPDGTFSSPSAGPKPLVGKAIGDFAAGTFAGFPDFQLEVISVTPVDAKTVAERFVWTATWSQPFPAGPLAGARPSGQSVRVPGVSYFVIESGKIRSETVYLDHFAVMLQMGLKVDVKPPQ